MSLPVVSDTLQPVVALPEPIACCCVRAFVCSSVLRRGVTTVFAHSSRHASRTPDFRCFYEAQFEQIVAQLVHPAVLVRKWMIIKD